MLNLPLALPSRLGRGRKPCHEGCYYSRDMLYSIDLLLCPALPEPLNLGAGHFTPPGFVISQVFQEVKRPPFQLGDGNVALRQIMSGAPVRKSQRFPLRMVR